MVIDRTKGPKINDVNHIDFVEPIRSNPGTGITLFEMGGLPEEVLQIEFQFDAGRKNQNKPIQASMTMEMLLEGSDGRRGSDIMDELDGYGAYIETNTELDRSSVSVYCMHRDFDKVLDLVMRIIYRPNFKENDFNVIRDNMRQNYLVESEKVSVLAKRAFMGELFKGTIYGHVAKLEDFDSISVQDCSDFHSKHIANGGTSVFVSGNISNQISSKLKKTLELMKLESPELIKSTFESTAGGNILVEKKNAMQSGIRKGKTTIGRSHDDYAELQVLVTILGGYFGSRLMMNIREDKGYTYGIGAGLASYDHAGMLYIATEVGSDYKRDTLEQITFEIERLKSEPVPQHELTLVKNYLKGSLARSADGQFAMMERFKTVFNSDLGLDYYDDYIHKVSNVTSERLKQLANQYLNEKEMIQVIAG